ncbi:anhydro-N-acetylmuramic acid kinase [Palleronia marisminoris]|uniref:Anhydro-N-acetylmuramic acid kinase n=1 Tax=Palleronia marisminoris TaxID=315423 RepID=A0A1Y5S4F0_9RHOB|nr:anhydro-N-acetylmuramic acid kinase [Palleronia marisminoris]SFG62788.1 anhydro-N-acetylmuramic acid kinase [Palleronia marisminoris]SLN31953.1 Anhydro-N-acetylmuramic acid kinase [Palleronia marisminoris]
MEPAWTVGLMTGTVLDGNIDVALLRSDGVRVTEFGRYTLAPYDRETRDLLAECLSAARAWAFDGPEPELFAVAEDRITRAQAEAVRTLVAEAGLSMDDIAAVGFHGQTVLHRAPEPGRLGRTRQLGDGALMAGILGTTVVYDFRSGDMAAGGQGAPLSAVFHGALLDDLGASDGTAVLNLGGVANVTARDPSGALIAFDTGPANAPINDLVAHLGLGEMDRGGQLAAAGQVDEARLRSRLDHAYLARPYPKSLDRFDFGYEWALDLSPEDGAATLTAFTAAAVGRGLDLLPERPTRLIVCGGGRHNPTLLRMLEDYAGVRVDQAEDVGWQGDAIEAQCFAFLALRRLRDLPATFPGTTGVSDPMTAGCIAGG